VLLLRWVFVFTRLLLEENLETGGSRGDICIDRAWLAQYPSGAIKPPGTHLFWLCGGSLVEHQPQVTTTPLKGLALTEGKRHLHKAQALLTRRIRESSLEHPHYPWSSSALKCPPGLQ